MLSLGEQRHISRHYMPKSFEDMKPPQRLSFLHPRLNGTGY